MKVDIDVLLRVRNESDNWNETIEKYNKETGQDKTYGTLSSSLSRYRQKNIVQEEETHVSERYIELETSKYVTEYELLEMHGYDPLLWEIVSSNSTRSKIGTKGNEEQYFINTYSKITVKKRQLTINYDNIEDLFEQFNIKIESVNVDTSKNKSDRMLKISLPDMHFREGANEHYGNIRDEILEIVNQKKYDKIVIVQGGDWFNANGSEGLTVKGTKVDHEMPKNNIFGQAMEFICPIIESSLKQANNVSYHYIEGNHDKDLAFGFAYGISLKYPQLEMDIEEEVFKYVTYGNIFIGLTHGDKPKGIIYFNLYRRVMANYDTIEIHTEHVHHEKVNDRLGMIHRVMPTPNDTDTYNYENGHSGTNKVLILLEYNQNKMKNSYVIDGEF